VKNLSATFSGYCEPCVVEKASETGISFRRPIVVSTTCQKRIQEKRLLFSQWSMTILRTGKRSHRRFGSLIHQYDLSCPKIGRKLQKDVESIGIWSFSHVKFRSEAPLKLFSQSSHNHGRSVVSNRSRTTQALDSNPFWLQQPHTRFDNNAKEPNSIQFYILFDGRASLSAQETYRAT
jgi:hypothetical protein